jgi:hypothetical protein
LIERGVTRDGYIGGSRSSYQSKGLADAGVMVGVGILAGAVAVGGIVLASVLKKARK